MHNVKTRRNFLEEFVILGFAAFGLTSFKNILQTSSIPRIGYFGGAGYSELESAFTE